NRWPLESFAEAILQLKTALTDLPLFVLWAPGRSTEPVFPGDDDRIGRLQERLGGREGIHFAGGLALRELFALLSLSRLFIGCDGGAMHAAAALGTPVVAIFGKTDPRRWRPWGRDHIVLTPSDGDIRTVSVEEVVSSALRRLLPLSGGELPFLNQKC
ncbi:MAG: glycosyltransferase family 9 protein, partial [Deltaproteobacteria bacterium]|nr:glycosyltransferase family 9 protein [Deltaproteobacteria bacterium]